MRMYFYGNLMIFSFTLRLLRNILYICKWLNITKLRYDTFFWDILIIYLDAENSTSFTYALF